MVDQTAVMTQQRVEIKEPDMYLVLVHNDDYTPMDFVVELLQKIFRKSDALAQKIMMDIHEKGVGAAGIYTQDIARTKVTQAHTMARGQEHPLRCSVELASGGQQ